MFTKKIFALTCVLFLASAGLFSGAIAADDASSSTAKEAELLGVLRSEAPPAEKAITCKLLAIHGSDAAVDELAKLLSDPQLASWARIALEAIPGAAADSALRTAADSLQGKLLVGVINSIGVRQDAKAVESLSKRLQDQDASVAAAAAVALGRIGNPSAATALRAALVTAPESVRSAVAEGCVLCAERSLHDGDSSLAVAIYDEVRMAQVPLQRQLEATRGAILARGQEGIPLLIEQFRSADKKMFQLALSTAREFPEGDVDRALAAELERLAPERAALMIYGMADRPETVVLPAVLQAAQQGPAAVRLAAISVLGRIGDASCLPALLEIGVEQDERLSQTARTTLAEIPGQAVDERIRELLPAATGSTYPLLLELVGQRRIDAVPELLKAVEHADAAVRRAALVALGETISLPRLSVLIDQVVAPKFTGDAAAAQQALKAASVRMPDREACAAELSQALARTDVVQTKLALLEILGAMGGPQALQTIGAAAKNRNTELQDTSSRLLGEWMTADAAPVLLDLAATAPGEKYQVRALRGYIRIARQFVLPDAQRTEMCRSAWAAARQPAEQKLVLDVLKRYPSSEHLQLALEAAAVPEVKAEAVQAALEISQKLGTQSSQLVELLKNVGLAKVKLEIVKAEYGAGSVQKDVTALLRKQAGEVPLISLAAGSYNASLGGDPAPGTPKQLKIQYRIDGKAGEASFAENALILLPVPK